MKKINKANYFLSICNLDKETGFSDKVFIKNTPLETTNGGDWCRSDSSLGKKFNIERYKEKNKIIAVQLQGYKKNTWCNKIADWIKKELQKQYCNVLFIHSNYIEIDHKDGRKDDYGLPERQDINDFQPLHKAVNIAKREHCKKCKTTNLRFDATKLGYNKSTWIGDIKYNGSCIGCYWYDPIKFNQKISKE